jgi:hypothetical protein
MSRLVTRSLVAASLLVLAACGGNTQTADVEESAQQSPSVSVSPPTGKSSASPAAEPTGQTSTPPPSPAVKDDDLRLMRDFVAFAIQPSTETARRLPFAGEVQLGLSRDLRTALDAVDAPQASAWVLKAKYFRAYTGPFSALELIQRHTDDAHSRSIRARGGAFHVSVGDHPHCASPPVPAPRGFEQHRRVSVQPSESSIDSCLSWFTADLYLNEEGSISAVTLDVWEP